MGASRLKRNTWLFLAFLLLGGAGHIVESISNSLADAAMFCADFMIYTGLLFFWTLSVRGRLLSSRAKRYFIAAAVLMALFLFLRACKYRIFEGSAPLRRYCWYGYYIPVVAGPTLFLMSSVRFSAARGRRWDERLLLLPAGLIALGVLTNDLHGLAFARRVPLEGFIGSNGTYDRGPLFYLAWAWAGAALAAGVFNLLWVFRRRGDRRQALLPLLFILLIPALIFLRDRFGAHRIPFPFQWPEIVIFCLLGLMESCIRLRLIPHNENYPGFFAQMPFPAMITDLGLAPVYRTARPIAASGEQLAAALEAPLRLDADTRLLGMPIRGGRAFFAEDESALNRLNEALEDANDTLALENELIRRERELIEEKAGIEERTALYAQAARAVYPAQKRIAALLREARPDTPGFRPAMARVLALTAYVKRKANFVMLSAGQETITAAEVASAMRESAHYLAYCGMEADVSVRAAQPMPCRTAMAVYDCFEAAAEALLGKSAALWARLDERTLLIQADADEAPELPDLPLRPVCACQDGQVTLRFAIGGEAI